MTEKEKKCANCGHARMHHQSLGGVTFCAAVISRVPKKLCPCKAFKDVMK